MWRRRIWNTSAMSFAAIVQLHLPDGTVRNCLSSLFAQLGVSDRTQTAVPLLFPTSQI
jgi:hypothetical protein